MNKRLSRHRTRVGARQRGPSRAIPHHVDGLLRYLSAPQEKANEDLALAYFRHMHGEQFTRQKEAKLSDGYVPGHFVLELKGKHGDWFAGLIQGIAYRKNLDFGSVIVAANGFLAVWHVADLPGTLLTAVSNEAGAPSAIGKRLASQFRNQTKRILSLAAWKLKAEQLAEGGLFNEPSLLLQEFTEFEAAVEAGKRMRLAITPVNFVKILKGMIPFFAEPLKAVRAFYSIIFSWKDGSVVTVSERSLDQAALGGETVSGLIPKKRDEFKEYVERYAVLLGDGESYDDFFAKYDRALDTVDPSFRAKHGIFFTDLSLAKLAMWFVKKEIGDIGQNHLVIDPACGSGNLVTNWRSPLELRHKVVSEIEPEMLFAVERRMQGDAWHQGKFTVVPQVSEGRGINFLEHDAATYLNTIRKYIKAKGYDANKPIAFLCNPPYRNDDDRTRADSVGTEVNKAIIDLIGSDAASESYCAFLAQMKLVCDAAEDKGLPGDSLVLVFTKVGWLTQREVLTVVQQKFLESFEPISGLIVNGSEFFDIGRFPVAFTMWRYRDRRSKASSPERKMRLKDLSWLSQKQLAAVPWGNGVLTTAACNDILADARSLELSFDVKRTTIREWAAFSSVDFKRARRVVERDSSAHVGGLPAGDRRLENKKAYGESRGEFVGFMDDRTPCRIRRSIPNVPWFRLDVPFMDCRKSRCFSAPPDQKGYCADPRSPESSERVFLWYAIQKSFAEHGYPMWADAMDLWAPRIPNRLQSRICRLTYAITFADNECLELRFPANNPVPGAPEVRLSNPLSPNDTTSFWSKHLVQHFDGTTPDGNADLLVKEVLELYASWKKLFRVHEELPVDVARPWYIGESAFVTRSSGMSQMRDYAEFKQDQNLLHRIERIKVSLGRARNEFHELLTGTSQVNYFGSQVLGGVIGVRPANDQQVRQPRKRARTA
jgi:hypothetical protein